ncbi:MAG: hypothetical protein CL840_01105 [Crocinitomicaceae bacterium]|nr:hypothetical protein [Crocinitomicaceae bacterium]|tara:strand:+ start:64758 stop:65279 length:522 start_codon:yes stop_codon:yes gene_type:complete
MKRILTSLSAAIALVASTGAMATEPNTSDLVPVQQAKDSGFTACLGAVEKLSNFLIGDASGNYGAHGIWSTTETTNKIYSAQIERNFSDGVMIMNMSVVHNKAGTCSSQYTKTFMSDETCMKYAMGQKDAKYKGELNKETGLFDDGGAYVYLQPVGQKCLVIRKEIIDLPSAA